MMKTYNFCAGPAMLPTEVMQQAQTDFVNWQGLGCSVMEISHRSPEFLQVAREAEQDLRDLMSIPDNYAVLFMHGGGRGQFSAVPLNLAQPGKHAEYLVTGSWSDAAVKEAQKVTQVKVTSLVQTFDGKKQVTLAESYGEGASYVHYCPNETVDGIELSDIPNTNGVPLVADMSSCILSESIDVSRFAVIYAGAQKNIGPSGLSIAIVRKDLLERSGDDVPCIFSYALTAEHDSMYNTPPTFAWYLAGLVFKWLKANGGVAGMQDVNARKAHKLYQYIDQSDFYLNHIAACSRSRMNVPFQLADATLDKAFLTQAEAQGLLALKGHRSVGGMRASIYNAMPEAGVDALIAFMQEFAQQYQENNES